MKTTVHRRLWVYSIASLLVGGLLGAGFIHEGEPDLGTLINGADILAKVGAHDKAILECEKVLERDPGNLQAHLIFAWSQDELGHYTESLAHYRTALDRAAELGLADLVLHIRLAVADLHRKHGRFEEANLACLRIDDEYGCSSQSSMVRGLALRELGRLGEAIEVFREAAERDPEAALPRYYLGLALRDAGILDEAQQAFVAQAEREGNPFGAWFQVASVRAEAGDRDGMMDALRRAAEHNAVRTQRDVFRDDAFFPYMDEETFQEFLVGLGGPSPHSL